MLQVVVKVRQTEITFTEYRLVRIYGEFLSTGSSGRPQDQDHIARLTGKPLTLISQVLSFERGTPVHGAVPQA